MKTNGWALFLLALGAPLATAAEIDWQPFRDQRVVEIVTRDEDGAFRETRVWIVVLEDHGYVRTSESRWLANIRRGSEVVLRREAAETPMVARETADPEIAARVEAAFIEKYGFVQRVMSAFRINEPTVLELGAR